MEKMKLVSCVLIGLLTVQCYAMNDEPIGNYQPLEHAIYHQMVEIFQAHARAPETFIQGFIRIVSPMSDQDLWDTCKEIRDLYDQPFETICTKILKNEPTSEFFNLFNAYDYLESQGLPPISTDEAFDHYLLVRFVDTLVDYQLTRLTRHYDHTTLLINNEEREAFQELNEAEYIKLLEQRFNEEQLLRLFVDEFKLFAELLINHI